MKPVILAAALLVATLGATAPSPAPRDANTVIARMLDRNSALQTFRSRVHVSVRMLNFPWLAPNLDGTSYFKRPNNYEVVFDRVPRYAKGFERMFNDIGDPAVWQKDENVTLDGTRVVAGKPQLVLRMTKKIHSDTLAYTLAFVDPQTYELTRMEWHYTNGGTIAMTQAYRREGGFSVIASQHAEIDIPHVRAVADSSYGVYQTNVAVDETVFAK